MLGNGDQDTPVPSLRRLTCDVRSHTFLSRACWNFRGLNGPVWRGSKTLAVQRPITKFRMRNVARASSMPHERGGYRGACRNIPTRSRGGRRYHARGTSSILLAAPASMARQGMVHSRHRGLSFERNRPNSTRWVRGRSVVPEVSGFLQQSRKHLWRPSLPFAHQLDELGHVP